MKVRSKLALLAHVRELMFEREQGSQGESGWTQGAYQHLGTDQVGKLVIRNCLNGALVVAERDVFQLSLFSDDDPGNRDYARAMQTEEGKGAQRLLAEACAELRPQVLDGFRASRFDEDGQPRRGFITGDGFVATLDEVFNDPSACHQVIVNYNDGETDQDDIDAALELAEKKGFEDWMSSHPAWQPREDDAFSDFESFIDAILNDDAGRLKKTSR